jgi:hypothetical protein
MIRRLSEYSAVKQVRLLCQPRLTLATSGWDLFRQSLGHVHQQVGCQRYSFCFLKRTYEQRFNSTRPPTGNVRIKRQIS